MFSTGVASQILVITFLQCVHECALTAGLRGPFCFSSGVQHKVVVVLHNKSITSTVATGTASPQNSSAWSVQHHVSVRLEVETVHDRLAVGVGGENWDSSLVAVDDEVTVPLHDSCSLSVGGSETVPERPHHCSSSTKSKPVSTSLFDRRVGSEHLNLSQSQVVAVEDNPHRVTEFSSTADGVDALSVVSDGTAKLVVYEDLGSVDSVLAAVNSVVDHDQVYSFPGFKINFPPVVPVGSSVGRGSMGEYSVNITVNSTSGNSAPGDVVLAGGFSLREQCNTGYTPVSSEYLHLSHVQPVVPEDNLDVVGSVSSARDGVDQ